MRSQGRYHSTTFLIKTDLAAIGTWQVLNLIIVWRFAIGKSLKNMKIKVRCCVPDCPDCSQWHILDYLYAVLMTRSLKPYVCVKHHHLFDDIDTSDYDPVKDVTDTTHTSQRVRASPKSVNKAQPGSSSPPARS